MGGITPFPDWIVTFHFPLCRVPKKINKSGDTATKVIFFFLKIPEYLVLVLIDYICTTSYTGENTQGHSPGD